MRYVPRTPPSSLSALEVNRRARELNPDPEVGEEGSVSPDVFMAAMQNRFDQHAAGVQGKREFVKGAGKLGWAVASDAGKAKARALPGKAYGATKDLLLGKQIVPTMEAGKGAKVTHDILTGGKTMSVTAKSAADAAAYTAGKGARAGGILGKVGTAGQTAFATGKTALTAAAASPAAPFVAAAAAFLALNRSKEGTKLAKWTNARLGTKGRFKNLFSPWKWRI